MPACWTALPVHGLIASSASPPSPHESWAKRSGSSRHGCAQSSVPSRCVPPPPLLPRAIAWPAYAPCVCMRVCACAVAHLGSVMCGPTRHSRASTTLWPPASHFLLRSSARLLLGAGASSSIAASPAWSVGWWAARASALGGAYTAARGSSSPPRALFPRGLFWAAVCAHAPTRLAARGTCVHSCKRHHVVPPRSLNARMKELLLRTGIACRAVRAAVMLWSRSPASSSSSSPHLRLAIRSRPERLGPATGMDGSPSSANGLSLAYSSYLQAHVTRCRSHIRCSARGSCFYTSWRASATCQGAAYLLNAPPTRPSAATSCSIAPAPLLPALASRLMVASILCAHGDGHSCKRGPLCVRAHRSSI